jgi:hypothetical protein
MLFYNSIEDFYIKKKKPKFKYKKKKKKKKLFPVPCCTLR